MRIFLYSITVIVCLCIFTGCQNYEKKKETERIHKELLALHDEEMGKMDFIYQLLQKLTIVQESVSDEKQKQEIQLKIDKLKQADEAMMNWMRNFKEPDESRSHEEKQNYYSEQLVKMNSVKILMESSIDSAKVTLKNYETKTN